MLTFKHFNAKQLQDTDGFKRKLQKVAPYIGVINILYSEIMNIEPCAIDVLIVDSEMYFHKIHLYSEEAVRMLNQEIARITSSIGLSNKEVSNTETIKKFNLFDEITSVLSRSIELLNIENTSNIDRLQNVTSSNFNVTLENFTYAEFYKALEPFAKIYSSIYGFKIINLEMNAAEILAITTDCKLYQYTIYFDSSYSRFINRYVSAYVPYEDFKLIRLYLKDFDFSKAIYKSIKKKIDVTGFLSFLLEKSKSKISEKGLGIEGLKNVSDFFFQTSASEEDAKQHIRHYYKSVPNYEQKRPKK